MKEFNYIKFLDKVSFEKGYRVFSFKSYKTGSSYVNINRGELTIRISDHEPNYAMERIRGSNDHEIYTRSACNEILIDDIGIVDRVLDITGVEISEDLQKELEEAREARDEFNARQRVAAKRAAKEIAAIQAKVKDFSSQLLEAIEGREEEIEEILQAAEAYGAENPKKRRKREVSFFKREFKNIFGFEATPGDIQRAKRIV